MPLSDGLNICVCVCVCMYVFMYACMHVYKSIHICLQTTTWTSCVCMYVCMYACMHVHICMYVCMYVCMYKRMHVWPPHRACACKHSYIHMDTTCVYVHMHAFMCVYEYTYVCTEVYMHEYVDVFSFGCVLVFSLAAKCTDTCKEMPKHCPNIRSHTQNDVIVYQRHFIWNTYTCLYLSHKHIYMFIHVYMSCWWGRLCMCVWSYIKDFSFEIPTHVYISHTKTYTCLYLSHKHIYMFISLT
jgi:hypothetical protein